MTGKIIVRNKRASYDFQLIDKKEVGMVLLGSEVKGLRLGKVKIAESYITIDKREQMWIYNMSIPQYTHANINNHIETRKRKLLLHKKEIILWQHKMKSEGLTLIPISLYFKKNLVKLEIALARGKKKHDKRQAEKTKEAQKMIKSVLAH